MEDEVMFAVDTSEEASASRDAAEADTEKYLLFLSDALLFGAKAEYVVEIITNHTITPLPLVPEYIRGVINLRGQILPIVDIRLLLGHPVSDESCIIILNIEGTLVGILVDTVQRMVDLKKSAILPAPGQRRDMVCGMYSLGDGQTVLLFDCAQILIHS